MNTNKKLFNDIFLNILATIILTIATQIIAFPISSRIVSIEKYGQILTVIGLMNLIGVSFGNSLNNSRLLLNKKIDEEKKYGDFNLLFIIAILLTISIMIVTLSLLKMNIVEVVLISLSACMLLIRAYYSVEYRIYLNYKMILILSFYSLVGYIIGSGLSLFTKNWLYIFFIGESLPSLYLIYKSSLIREGLKLTSIFNLVSKNYILIFSGAFLTTLIVYMDRFLVSYKLGDVYVSILVVASFLGKSFGILIGPIATVLLSYYVKDNKITIKSFYYRIFVFLLVSILSFVAILIFGPFILKILYPSIVVNVYEYFFIANLGSILFVFGNLIQPTLLVTVNVRWNTLIQTLFFILFLLLSLVLINKFQLIGLFYSIIISNVFRILLMIFVIRKKLVINEKRR